MASSLQPLLSQPKNILVLIFYHMASFEVEELRLPAGEQAVYDQGLTFPLVLKAPQKSKEETLNWISTHIGNVEGGFFCAF